LTIDEKWLIAATKLDSIINIVVTNKEIVFLANFF